MKTALAVLLSFFVLSACGGGSARLGTSVTLSPGPITINGPILYIQPNMIGQNVWECQATNNVQSIETITFQVSFDVG